jgi:hypothetical protein
VRVCLFCCPGVSCCDVLCTGFEELLTFVVCLFICVEDCLEFLWPGMDGTGW